MAFVTKRPMCMRMDRWSFGFVKNHQILVQARWLRVKDTEKGQTSNPFKYRRNGKESWYMENVPAWSSNTKSGNPTKIKLVNNLVQYIKKKEVRND